MRRDRWPVRRRPLELGTADHPHPTRPCIVHLVRAANGKATFEAFVEAMHRYPPGVECDFVLAMKGFAGHRDAQPYVELAQDLSPEHLYFGDDGLDLTVYFAAAARLRRDRYCFLNSFSQPLIEGWLAKLDAPLAQAGVGMTGATGSWASSFSRMAHLLYIPSAYRGVLPERRVALEQFIAIDLELRGEVGPSSARPGHSRLAAKLRALRDVPGETLPFERFPAYHVRTNAFMISHATLAQLRLHAVRKKRDAYLLEHGRQSITRQVQRLGLRTLVVDRHGVAYDHDQWYRSRTFWQGEQEGLLVADNQTRRYADADPDRRRLLSGFAWGMQADPTVPGSLPLADSRPGA
jgi:hypothetical protein